MLKNTENSNLKCVFKKICNGFIKLNNYGFYELHYKIIKDIFNQKIIKM